MNNTALITLSSEGLITARNINRLLLTSSLHVHNTVEALDAEPFNCLADLLRTLWNDRRKIVIFAPIGAVVRSLNVVAVSKHTDPAIVVADVFGRWTIPILSSHEGGANELALKIANILGAEPIITTTKEAIKNVIVGIGCRRNASCDAIVNAIDKIIESAGISIPQIRLMASISAKMQEKGLIEAAHYLHLPLRFISQESIQNSPIKFSVSQVAIKHLGLPGAAEPSALLAGTRTKLILPRTIVNGIAIALAKEELARPTLPIGMNL